MHVDIYIDIFVLHVIFQYKKYINRTLVSLESETKGGKKYVYFAPVGKKEFKKVICKTTVSFNQDIKILSVI